MAVPSHVARTGQWWSCHQFEQKGVGVVVRDNPLPPAIPAEDNVAVVGRQHRIPVRRPCGCSVWGLWFQTHVSEPSHNDEAGAVC